MTKQIIKLLYLCILAKKILLARFVIIVFIKMLILRLLTNKTESLQPSYIFCSNLWGATQIIEKWFVSVVATLG